MFSEPKSIQNSFPIYRWLVWPPDRRGDEHYVQWEEGYSNWQEQLDETKSAVQDLITAYADTEVAQNTGIIEM